MCELGRGEVTMFTAQAPLIISPGVWGSWGCMYTALVHSNSSPHQPSTPAPDLSVLKSPFAQCHGTCRNTYISGMDTPRVRSANAPYCRFRIRSPCYELVKLQRDKPMSTDGSIPFTPALLARNVPARPYVEPARSTYIRRGELIMCIHTTVIIP